MSDQISPEEHLRVAKKLLDIPDCSPRSLEAEVRRRGYRGQVHAVRSACVFAYRHLQRLKMCYLDEIPAERLPPREHLLLIGPSGCGKTHLLQILFQHILGIPSCLCDMTRFTETGYVGEDTISILTRLYEAAGGDNAWAECGVIVLDEFDKLAAHGSNLLFGGSGSSKDVSGLGVQRELLGLLSLESSDFPTEFRGPRGPAARKTMRIANISAVCCGAFTGLHEIRKKDQSQRAIGFAVNGPRSISAKSLSEELAFDNTPLTQWGLIHELVARMRPICLDPLSPSDLRSVLEDNVIPRLTQEFECESLTLSVTDAAREHAVQIALKRATGARALDRIYAETLEDVAFTIFGTDEKSANSVVIDWSEANGLQAILNGQEKTSECLTA